MKVELHERHIVHEILYHVHFPFNLFLFGFFFFLLLWLKTNLETWNFAEKSCSEEIRADYFKMAPLFFLKFGHIDWLLLYFVKVVCFFFISITLYVVKYVVTMHISHISFWVNGRYIGGIVRTLWNINIFFPCYKYKFR